MFRMKTGFAASLLMTLLIPPVAQGQLYGLTEGSSAPMVVHFKLSGPLIERPMGEAMTFSFEPVLSLQELLDRMDQAREDESVKGVVVTFESPMLGFAQMQELREAIAGFKAVDKAVYVHAESLNTGLYALACAGSHVSVVPAGDVWLTGLYSESPYLRGLLDMIGVQPEIIHMGDYKSAGEILTRKGPSEEAEEMMEWLFSDLYESLTKMIAESRGLTEERVRQLIDDGPYTAEEAKAAGLIDSVQYAPDLVSELKSRYGRNVKIVRNYGADDLPKIDFSNPFSAFTGLLEEFSKSAQRSTKPAIAIVYVDGPIMVGSEKNSPFGASDEARSTTIRRALDEALDDPSIKAVVLRVDSPGGSALASDIIWNATQRVAERKPMIASMGNVAASGGYYVSCGADTIFADPTTLTASIGVVGGKLVTTEMWNKLGIHWHARQRGEHADLLNTSEPFSEEEREIILKYMEDVYETFKKRVTDGRGEKLTKPIDEIAGGRVFTGRQAVNLGLVDRLGTMNDAIRHAASTARISDYEIRTLPKPMDLFEMFSEMFSPTEKEDDISLAGSRSGRAASPLADSALVRDVLPVLRSADPQRAEALRTALVRLQLIHQERVIMMLPFEMVIR